MYKPKFEITNSILKSIGNIDASREIIENAPLVPAWDKKFRDEAMVKVVHYGTHLEGNDLTFTQAEKVLDGQEIIARERDIQEVINYRNVLKYIDSQQESKKYTFEQLRKIHYLTVYKIIKKEEWGNFRKAQVVLKNTKTSEIAFRPPHFSEVEKLTKDLFDWLNATREEYHPVFRAAITHYVISAIHPFVEGNGRTARAMATLVLFSEGYDIKKFFSLEEYFDKDATSYYKALMEVSNQSGRLEERDLTPWISYFCQALSIELSKIKEKVKKLSVDLKFRGKLGRQISLSERQIKLIEYLEEIHELTVPDARQILPMISDDTILRDLKDLQEKGIIKKKGKTKAAKYMLCLT